MTETVCRECQTPTPRDQGEGSSERRYSISQTVIKMTPLGPRKLTLFDGESS